MGGPHTTEGINVEKKILQLVIEHYKVDINAMKHITVKQIRQSETFMRQF